jgi:hypothetical protein
MIERLARLVRWGGALAGLLAAGGTSARPVVPAAPAAWIAYAEAATATVATWLRGEDEAALRLRAYLAAAQPADPAQARALVLKLWIGADGTVSRIGFAAFAHAEPNNDLQALIVDKRLPPPPNGMLQPIRVAVEFEAPPHEPSQPAP